jgi:SAM-dependent methyltransferase
MPLPAHTWHQRYLQQARWTADLRAHIFEQLEISSSDKILEVGSGTGAILSTIPSVGNLFGVDIDYHHASMSRGNVALSHIICGDGHRLPYQDNVFAVSLCHFLLLWVTNPKRVLEEMMRVTRPKGNLLILAEPDYGGRIDHPETLGPLGKLQAASLQNQGADPYMGRKVIGLVRQFGIEIIEAGVISNRWQESPSEEERALEWAILEEDFQNLPAKQQASVLARKEFNWLRQEEDAAWKNGSRVLFIPTFYVWGRVP